MRRPERCCTTGPQPGFSAVSGWSSDGRYLALSTGDSPSPTVTIWNRATGDTAQIATAHVAWSHLGHRLAYVAPYDTATPAPAIEVHVRDLDTDDDRVVATDRGQTDGAVYWSPDDRFIAFGTAVPPTDGPSESTKSAMHVVDTTGAQPDAVIPDASPAGWLDDRTLYFEGNVCSGFDIFTASADGSQIVDHTQSAEIDLYPWSAPDGHTIAFTTVPGRLRLLSLTDGAIRDLGDLPGAVLYLGIGPTGTGEPWSPDGRYLAVAVAGAHGLCQD